jgi:hypothetical protein
VRSLRAPATIAGALASAIALAFGCGGEESSRPPVVPPVTVRPVAGPEPARELVDASVAEAPPEDAGVLLPRPKRAALPEPAFGAAEPAKPGDPHAMRIAASLRLMRSTRSGAKVLKMLSVFPEVIDARSITGVDPFADGEWLLVYGSGFLVPGRNANVVRHLRPEAELTRAHADAGLAASDAGPNAVRAEIYGVRGVLLRPQAGLLALVPSDRAADLSMALSKPLDSGTKPGELARIFIAEPARLARFLPADVVRGTVTVKAATDGGLDVSAEAECPDAVSCKTTATAVEELAAKQNSLVVRIVLKNLLANLAVRARGSKLEATLHAAPEQVDAVLNLARSQLGLPAEDPSDARH